MLSGLLAKLASTQTKLVAVSKTKSPDQIMAIYEQGQRCFGENRALELAKKYELLPKDIEWHMIGHLQSNKVKYIAPFVQLIHSADSPKLIREIDKQAARHDRQIDLLLQFKIAQEAAKFGFDKASATTFLQSKDYADLKHIRVCGVMGMATFTNDGQQIRQEFKTLFDIYKHLKISYFEKDEAFQEVSMGMSGDYEIAIEEGSTMVRIGSLLFGAR